MQITGGELRAEGTASAKALRKECAWNRMKGERVVGGAGGEVGEGQEEWGLEGHSEGSSFFSERAGNHGKVLCPGVTWSGCSYEVCVCGGGAGGVSSSIWAYITKYHQTGRLVDNRNLFLAFLEAGKSDIQALADLVSGETHLLVHRWLTSHCVLTWWKGRGSSLGPLL